jgi:hypothetical protein
MSDHPSSDSSEGDSEDERDRVTSMASPARIKSSRQADPNRKIRFGDFLDQNPRLQRVLFLVVVSPVVLLAVLFWQVPVDDPLDISALLLDRSLEVGTAILLPIGILLAVFGPWPIARIAAVICGLVGVLCGGSALLAAVRPPVEPIPTIAAAASVVAGATLMIWVLHVRLSAAKWKAASLLAIPLALLPALQFWHATSFVPSRLNNSMTVTATPSVQGVFHRANAKSTVLRGVLTVQLRNQGDVGALILASEVTLCFRQDDVNLEYDIEKLYHDKYCTTDVILEHTSKVDAKSTWTYHSAFTTTPDRPLAQVVAHVWYARNDRIRIGPEILRKPESRPPSEDLRTGCKGSTTRYRLIDDARFKGVVARHRYLTYDDRGGSGDAYFFLTTEGEPLCLQSRYDLDRQLGTTDVVIHTEDWLQVPSK